MSKPVIKITYYGEQEPKIELPPGLDVKFEFIDGEELNQRFMEHGGLTIYHTLNDSETVSENFFATEMNTPSCHDYAFDWRELPEIPADEEEKYLAMFPDSSDIYSALKQAIAYAIDKGHITGDGIK
jgi:hypothetical protein